MVGYNMDARDFVREMAKRQLAGQMGSFAHVVMNLPAMGIEFLGTLFLLCVIRSFLI